MEHPSPMPRPSGIPRPAAPSRLPVLRAAGSQSQLRPRSSAEQLRKTPSVSSLARPSPPPLQKKASRASLPGPSPPPAAPASRRGSLAPTPRRVSGIPNSAPRPSASTEPVFKRPFARPPSRQTAKPAPPPAAWNPLGEDDAVGSLHGFRSASRASSRAASRAGFSDHDAEPDHVRVDERQPEPDASAKRKARPSLSERTIESLSQLPSSPAGGRGRRRSSFFSADNTMPPPLRPASAMSSNSSRPTTSDGPASSIPATPKTFATSSGRLSMTAPGKRSISAHVATRAATPSRARAIARPASTVKKPSLSLAQNLQNTPKPRPLSDSKSMIARTPRCRPSLAGTFGQAISPPGTVAAAPSTPSQAKSAPVKRTPSTVRKASSSSALREHMVKAKAARQSEVAEEPAAPSPKSGTSSHALREQIAKAREAARRAKNETSRTSTPPRDAFLPHPNEIASFDFGLDDPFNQRAKGAKSLLRKRIDGARVDGRLNIAAMNLKEMPDDVLNMYKYDPADTTVAWGDVTDLVSIIAADNELESLPEAMFPDVDFEATLDSDEEDGPQFCTLQSLDLHGNLLRELPVGLKRLTQLSRLHLSRNKLCTDVFHVISSIASLRELKLAENELHGHLPASVINLSCLEVLELQGNALTSLPNDMGKLASLRTLNVASNQLTNIPMELFEKTALVELVANSNRLEGTFFTVASAPHLQELNVSNNSLKTLCEGERMELPALTTLKISTNRLVSLPSVGSWNKLKTLIAAENKLTEFPDGFTSLQTLRTADFTANDISQLDEKLALMSLDHLALAANPLRERKFLTMTFGDIQRDLASRLPVELVETDADAVEAAEAEEDAQHVSGGWELTPSGTLDLSSQGLSELDETALLACADKIRHLNLQQNAFDTIPLSLSHATYLTVLDLSRNSIATTLTSPLCLSRLKEMRLNTNKMTCLEPLITHVEAPSLQILDISANRLVGMLPTLRSTYPQLISLIASDNRISEVPACSLDGLKMVNLANNDIERLEPQIGTLQGTLTSLNVEGNRFRVPNYQVMQKGTEAVLAWLRDRIPRDSWKSDGTEFFDADDGHVTF
ncbi:hypothetical protein ACEQ8H_001472 [Pleosporales sp. CAS-2024a]